MTAVARLAYGAQSGIAVVVGVPARGLVKWQYCNVPARPCTGGMGMAGALEIPMSRRVDAYRVRVTGGASIAKGRSFGPAPVISELSRSRTFQRAGGCLQRWRKSDRMANRGHGRGSK